MAGRIRGVVVAVRPGSSPRRAGEVARWIRSLLPAAVLLIGPVAPPVDPNADEVITIDAEKVQSGPLAVADALARHGRVRG